MIINIITHHSSLINMRFFLLLGCTAFFAADVWGQYISHGPVIGGVRDNGARMYVRTHTAQAFTLELSTDAGFSNPLSFSSATDASRDSSVIVDITGLAAGQHYYYRLRFGGNTDVRDGNFRTFPTEGQPAHFSFVTGSCQESPNMKVFDVMPLHDPLFLLHTGDYTYPSYQQDNTYPSQWPAIELSYRRRYQEAVMKEMLRYVPIDYMPDDDDNWGGHRDYGYRVGYYTDTATGKPVNYFMVDTITPIEQSNCLLGYRTFFPGYPTVDTTDGHYHSFRVGNCEFFVVDTRSCSDVPVNAYFYDSTSNLWSFNPASDHSILGDDQMNWLLGALSQSTADWKFIVSGVPFNPNIRRLIDFGLTLQEFAFTIAGENGTGFRLSASFAGYWAGYPDDIQQVLDHIQTNNITGVAVVSGDTHHNVMDDGTNSRLPELNASGMSVSTTELAYQINTYSVLLGQPSVTDSLWNAGGNGLHNTNFKNAFGKVEVFGADSVRFCVIDEDNVTLSCFVLYPDGTANNPWLGHTGTSSVTPLPVARLRLAPNPNDGYCTALMDGLTAGARHQLSVYDLSGKRLHQETFAPQERSHRSALHLPGLAAGTYLVVLSNEKGVLAYEQWVKL